MREDYGKSWFNIIDYTGSAMARFTAPDFDGCPETDYTAQRIRTPFLTADALRDEWADPLDLLGHLAFQHPLRTRRECAEHRRQGQPDLFNRYSVKAQNILGAPLDY